METRVQLNQDSVHIWSADQSRFGLPQLQTHCLHWLQADDLNRLQRLRIERHRIQLLLGQFLVRTVLSKYHSAIAPADWRFVKNAYGKPALDPDHQVPHLSFNLSHSRGRLVVAIAREDLLGVDIEASLRPRRIARIASRFFAQQEIADMLALPAEQQTERFYRLWTLKEAYIKARGLGLAIPVQQFGFSFHDHGRIKIAFDERLQDTPENWQFWQSDAGASHKLALAVRRKATLLPIAVQAYTVTCEQLSNAVNQ